MRLFGYWRSSCSYRVRIAMNLKGLSFETVPVHLVKGEQVAAAHLARNPKGEVPVLELPDGQLLSQSVAICEYLEETHPTPALLPADPQGRAKVRQLVEVVNSGIQPLQNFDVLKRIAQLGGDKKAWTQGAIERGFAALEALAAPVAGTYLYKDAPSLADVALVPQVYNALRFEVDMNAYPTLKRVHAHANAQAAFASAHPDQQPDAQ